MSEDKNKTELTRRAFMQSSLLGATAAAFVKDSLRRSNYSTIERVQLRANRVRPLLLFDADMIVALREKIAREPSKRIYETYVESARRGSDANADALILLALITNERNYKERAARSLMKSFRANKAKGASILNAEIAPGHEPRAGANFPRYDFSGLRFIHRLTNQYDVIASFNALTEAEDKEFRDYAFFAVERLLSPEIQRIEMRDADRRHNFHTDNLVLIGTVALAFPEHEKAHEWLDYALTEFDWQMQHSVFDGAWHETPRYHGAVLRSLIPFLYAVRRRNTNQDLFANKNFRALLDWLVRCQTPKDRVYGAWLRSGRMNGANGAETMAYPNREAVCESPALGDAEWVNYWFANLALAAPAYSRSDPQFAARLMWGWQRAGGPYAPESDLLLLPLAFIDPTIKPAPQKLASELMKDAGYAILRSDYDAPEEKYFVFTCGKRREEHWAGHFHRDQNSFSVFADGVPLALDAASGAYSTIEQALWHKATVSHNLVRFGGRDQEREDAEIIQFVSNDKADYLVGDATRAAGEVHHVLQWNRHVLFVKPDYFVIWDYIRSYVPSEWLLHSPAQEIRQNEYAIEFVTPWNVALDAHFVLPEAPPQVEFGEGRIGQWRKPDERGAPPFTMQKYARVRNEPGKDFLAVLHPRPTNGERLQVRKLSGTENFLEIKTAAQTDYVLLFPVAQNFRDEARRINFNGRCAVVRAGARNELILLDGETLAFRNQIINNQSK